jgi:hypothetical protein
MGQEERAYASPGVTPIRGEPRHVKNGNRVSRQPSGYFFIDILEQDVAHGKGDVAQDSGMPLFNRHVNLDEAPILMLPGERLEVPVKIAIATLERFSIMVLVKKLYTDYSQALKHHLLGAEGPL